MITTCPCVASEKYFTGQDNSEIFLVRSHIDNCPPHHFHSVLSSLFGLKSYTKVLMNWRVRIVGLIVLTGPTAIIHDKIILQQLLLFPAPCLHQKMIKISPCVPSLINPQHSNRYSPGSGQCSLHVAKN